MGRNRVASTFVVSFALTIAASVGLIIAGLLPAEAHSTFAFLTAPGRDSTQVKAFTQAGAQTDPSYLAYSSFSGGVFVASGDVNGDGHPDSITGAGAGGGPHVKVVDGITGSTLFSFFAYSSGFRGGVTVAAGDVNGDGLADIIAGAGPGGSPQVKVFDGDTGELLDSFFAYNPGFTGGVTVAAGDVNGDGLADIVTGAGAGGGPHVNVFDGFSGNLAFSFFAYGSDFRGGVWVGAGDVTGDGLADIITGAGAGGGPHVKVFDADGGGLFRSFFAYSSDFRGGVFVSGADINSDEFVDVITGAGAGGGPHVKVFDGDTGATALSFFAYSSSFRGGVRVGGNLGTHPPDMTVTGGPSDESTTNDATPGYNGTATDSDGTVSTLFVGVDPQTADDFTTAGLVCTGCGTASATWTFTPTTPLADGVHDIFFLAVDNSGLVGVDIRTVTVDTTSPTVTINQGATQADPANTSPIVFAATFSEAVTGFTNADVTVGGTAGGTKTVAVTGGPTVYTVEISGMTTAGTVTASIPAAAASDAGGNTSAASTSSDNTVAWDATPPTVTIEQGASQADPTKTSPITFTATFSESVTGFTNADVTVGGTAGGTKTAAVTGGPATYTVQVSGMTTGGTVTATIPAAAATDAAGNPSAASTSTDNAVTWDPTAPTFDSLSANATSTVTATFSEPLNCSTVAGSDFVAAIQGTPVGITSVTCTGASDATIGITLASAPANGDSVEVQLTGSVADPAGNVAPAPTSKTATADATAPTVTINQAASQADPTTTSPITFTATFSESVTGFTNADVTVGGTAGGTKTVAVTGGPATYTVQVSGMTTGGTVTASIPAAAATDVPGNPNAASTSTDNTVTWDPTAPTVTINQGASQVDPTTASPITFTATFSEAVTGFSTGDVSTTGSTAGGTLVATVTGGPTVYTVTVTGMTTDGTVVATIPAGVASDLAANANVASTSTDNSVTWDAAPSVTINQAVGQSDPTKTSPIVFTATFSEAVTGFATGDVTLSGTAGATTATVTGGPSTYTVQVTGMTSDGTVKATIAAGVAADADGALQVNQASTSTDNVVTYDTTAPSIAWLSAFSGNATVTAVFVRLDDPLLCSSVAAGDFSATVNGSLVTVQSVTCTGSSDATIDLTLSSAPSAGQAVVVSLLGTVTDRASNSVTTNSVSTFASAPTVSVTSGPADGSSSSDTTPTYGGTASDVGTPFTVSAIQVSTDGGATFSSSGVTCTLCGVSQVAPISWSWTPGSGLATGGYTFVFRAVDANGNFSIPVVRTLTIT